MVVIPPKILIQTTQRNQYNFLKEKSTLEEVKIAAFAIFGRFGTKYAKIALCAIRFWCTWGKGTGLHDKFGNKCAKNLTRIPIKL